MLWFASAIVQAFRISPNLTQIGLMKFSDEADIIFHLYNYTETDSILDALQKVDIDGGDTNIAGALQAARTEMFVEERGARPDVRRLIFLVTDGTANIDNELTQTEAQLTRDAGIEVFTVGVTSGVDKQQLKMIASYPPESHFYYVSEFQMLNLVVRNLTQNACLPPVTVTTTPTITTAATIPAKTTTAASTTTTTTIPLTTTTIASTTKTTATTTTTPRKTATTPTTVRTTSVAATAASRTQTTPTRTATTTITTFSTTTATTTPTTNTTTSTTTSTTTPITTTTFRTPATTLQTSLKGS